MRDRKTIHSRQQVSIPNLPLAIYREMAAHLRQVEGVETELIPQESQEFDYSQSQIVGLWLECNDTLDDRAQDRIDAVLNYYQQRYSTVIGH